MKKFILAVIILIILFSISLKKPNMVLGESYVTGQIIFYVFPAIVKVQYKKVEDQNIMLRKYYREYLKLVYSHDIDSFMNIFENVKKEFDEKEIEKGKK